MSEHADLANQLARVETKLDLLMRAFAQAHDVEFVMVCKDQVHARHSHEMKKCPSCDSWEGRPYVKKILRSGDM